METYAARMLAEARTGLQTHGSIREFLRDKRASFRVVAMYVAERLSVELNARLLCVDDLDPARAMRGVHLTDGVSVIVACILHEHITYADCAPFLLNAAAYANGAFVSAWRTILLVRDTRSTLCPDLEQLMGTYVTDQPIINTTEVEVCLSVLVGAHPVLDDHGDPDGPNEDAEDSESEDEDEGARERVQIRADITAYVARHDRMPETDEIGRRVGYIRSMCFRMPPEERALFEAIRFWRWHRRDARFFERARELRAYIALHGRLPPRFHRLGSWVTHCRERLHTFAEGRLVILRDIPGVAAAVLLA